MKVYQTLSKMGKEIGVDRRQLKKQVGILYYEVYIESKRKRARVGYILKDDMVAKLLEKK